MMMYTTIIWDFNGTLLNDVETGIRTENTLLARRGMPLLRDVAHYRSVFCFPIIEYYKKVGFDFDKEPYSAIAVEWVAEYMKNVVHAPLYDGVLDTLEILRRRGLPQVILSATELEMLTGQLKTLGIYDYFDDVLGLDNIEAYSKVEIGVRWMQWARPVRALFVGDTEHDAETAASMGVDCVLIPNGHQSEETLKKCKNAVLLHDIRELPAYLDSVSE